jgi:hypothetical protein
MFCTVLQTTHRMATLDPSLEKHQVQALWKTVDPNGAGVVEVNTIHDMLSGRYGVDKVTQKGAGVIERVIKKILERCGESAGIKGLQRYVYDIAALADSCWRLRAPTSRAACFRACGDSARPRNFHRVLLYAQNGASVLAARWRS